MGEFLIQGCVRRLIGTWPSSNLRKAPRLFIKLHHFCMWKWFGVCSNVSNPTKTIDRCVPASYQLQTPGTARAPVSLTQEVTTILSSSHSQNGTSKAPITASATPGNSQEPSQTGLSAQVKAGMGAGLGVVVLLLCFVAFISIKKYRSKRFRASSPDGGYAEAGSNVVREMDAANGIKMLIGLVLIIESIRWTYLPEQFSPILSFQPLCLSGILSTRKLRSSLCADHIPHTRLIQIQDLISGKTKGHL